jgi:hypothetical protein
MRKPSGQPWRKSDHARPFQRATARAGLDPNEVTIYALRHGSIVRQIKANVPIERHYSAEIADFAGESPAVRC